MPSLLIFDDDTIKCDLAVPVMKAWPKSASDWKLLFHSPLETKNSFDTFLSQLDNSDEPMVLVDIEIKKSLKGKDWRTDAAKCIAGKVESTAKLLYENEIARLESHYGKHPDYQLSLSLIAYLVYLGVPVITVSTKPNSANVESHNSVCAQSAGLPILYWAENWKTAWNGKAITTNAGRLATRIIEEWNKHKGKISQRLWPKDAAGWFPSKVGAISSVPHAWVDDLATKTAYLLTMGRYLSAISGVPVTTINRKQPKVCDVVKRRHESLKRIVGAVAKAHASTGYSPELNTVALLAAAWDPHASKWFPEYRWLASCQMLSEMATQKEIENVILAIGGEDGLFEHLLQQKPDTKKSTLKKIEDTGDKIALLMAFPLSKDSRGGDQGIMQKFNTAKASRVTDPSLIVGDTTQRLYDVWLKLGAGTKRIIDIEVNQTSILFFKATRTSK